MMGDLHQQLEHSSFEAGKHTLLLWCGLKLGWVCVQLTLFLSYCRPISVTGLSLILSSQQATLCHECSINSSSCSIVLLTTACCFCRPQIFIRCRLSRRQSQLYAALRKNLTLQDLVAMGSKSSGAGGAAGGGAASSRLMGLIMQMRKVRIGERCLMLRLRLQPLVMLLCYWWRRWHQVNRINLCNTTVLSSCYVYPLTAMFTCLCCSRCAIILSY